MNPKWLISSTLLLALLLMGMSACAKIARSQGNSDGAGAPLEINSLFHDGLERTFGLYSPESRDSTPSSLVFLLHGGGGGAEQIFNTEFGQSWRELADQHGFILVVPQGREDINSRGDHHWNDCRTGILNSDVDSQLDDVGFIEALIETMDAFYDIDRTRVYATGASNGGLMSFRLAFEATQRFAAIGAVIANLPEPSECREPTTHIPVLIMNGTEDPLMPHNGGCVANDGCRRGSVMSTESSVEFWIHNNMIEKTPTIKEFPDVDTRDGSTVASYTYRDDTESSEVVYYRVNGGGHTIPGEGPLGFAARLVVGPKNRDINGAEEIWAFFERHQR